MAAKGTCISSDLQPRWTATVGSSSEEAPRLNAISPLRLLKSISEAMSGYGASKAVLYICAINIIICFIALN